MEFSDSLSLFLRYGLTAVFVAYYITSWRLSAKLGPSKLRRKMLRWAFVPLLISAMIGGGCLYFRCAQGHHVVRAFMVTAVLSMLGAALFSIWLQRGGGKEMLYVPIAFARFRSDSTQMITAAIADLARKPSFRRDFALSLLPMLFAVMILILTIWETSRPLSS